MHLKIIFFFTKFTLFILSCNNHAKTESGQTIFNNNKKNNTKFKNQNDNKLNSKSIKKLRKTIQNYLKKDINSPNNNENFENKSNKISEDVINIIDSDKADIFYEVINDLKNKNDLDANIVDNLKDKIKKEYDKKITNIILNDDWLSDKPNSLFLKQNDIEILKKCINNNKEEPSKAIIEFINKKKNDSELIERIINNLRGTLSKHETLYLPKNYQFLNTTLDLGMPLDDTDPIMKSLFIEGINLESGRSKNPNKDKFELISTLEKKLNDVPHNKVIIGLDNFVNDYQEYKDWAKKIQNKRTEKEVQAYQNIYKKLKLNKFNKNNDSSFITSLETLSNIIKSKYKPTKNQITNQENYTKLLSVDLENLKSEQNQDIKNTIKESILSINNSLLENYKKKKNKNKNLPKKKNFSWQDNSCFLHAGIQALLNLLKPTDIENLSTIWSNQNILEKKNILEEIKNIYIKLNTNKGQHKIDYVITKKLRESLSTAVNSGKQEDAIIVISELLEAMDDGRISKITLEFNPREKSENQKNRKNERTKDAVLEYKKIINKKNKTIKNFCNIIQTTYKCNVCGLETVDITYENILILNVINSPFANIVSNSEKKSYYIKTLYESFNSTFKTNFVEQKNYYNQCKVCNKPSTTLSIERKIVAPANNLILQFDRFAKNSKNKHDQLITYPPILDFKNKKYELVSVIVHTGSNYGGHYISYIKNEFEAKKFNQGWYLADDTKNMLERVMPLEVINNQNAITLFYKLKKH